VALLLSAQVVALLLVGTYAHTGPRLGGFPFFYWYTLLWLLIGALCMAACAALTADPEEEPPAGPVAADASPAAPRPAAPRPAPPRPAP
jgi:hypothetical protein